MMESDNANDVIWMTISKLCQIARKTNTQNNTDEFTKTRQRGILKITEGKVQIIYKRMTVRFPH